MLHFSLEKIGVDEPDLFAHPCAFLSKPGISQSLAFPEF
jgi:hypothetical protein